MPPTGEGDRIAAALRRLASCVPNDLEDSPSTSPRTRAAARLAARLSFAPGTWGEDEPPFSLSTDTAWPDPPLCAGPGGPPAAVVPTLPLGDADPFRPDPPTPWRVLDLDAPQPSDAALASTLRTRRGAGAATAGTVGRPTARGSGGAAAAAAAREAATATAAAAAAAARSGAWLDEYENTKAPPPRTTLPGGGPGVFGAWAVSREGPPLEQHPRPPTRPPPPAAAAPLAAAPADLLFGAGWVDASSSSSEGEEGPGPAPPPRAEEEPAGLASATDAALAAPPRCRPRRGGGAASNTPPPPPPTANPFARWARRAPAAACAARYAALAHVAALAFPHPLDAFQREAIALLEDGGSVFVAAHTGAGKTAVAEYAAALAIQHGTRCFYTAPIKTISNQKFRDFSSKFETGIVTGDVSIRPDAPVVVMTTEVLRAMLYRGGGGELADVETVVFDEVHYLNDAERGVVWEEVLILLPRSVRVVLLSATVPNVEEFAGWVGRTRRTVVWVTGTAKRPVPLEHALWFRGELHTFGSREAWVGDGYAAARAAWKAAAGGGGGGAPPTRKAATKALPTGRGGGGGGRGGGRGGSRGPPSASSVLATAMAGSAAPPGPRTDVQQWRSLLAGLVSRDLTPAVIFLFSKKKVDALADALVGTGGSLELGGSPTDAAACHAFLDRALARLPPGDRALPQVRRLRRLLSVGVGVHHAGLLPILKEAVELLFCAGRVRLLLCTETFAMGVNAPARAVIFGSLRKHDGREFRGLAPGEYTQMAGRAGRRGLDAVGTVIIPGWIGGEGARPAAGATLPPLPSEADLRRLLTGRGDPLASQFRLTYGMILGLARREDAGLGVEGMARASFAEFAAVRAAPGAARAAAAADAEADALEAAPWEPDWPAREVVQAYADACATADACAAVLQAAAGGADGGGLAPALVPGRLVVLRPSPDSPATVGCVLGMRSSASAGRAAVILALDLYGEGASLVAGARAGGAAGGGGGEAPPPPAPAPAPAPGLRLLSRKDSGAGSGSLDALSRAPSAASLPPADLEALPLPLAGAAAGGAVPFILLAVPPLALDGVCAGRLSGLDPGGAVAGAAAMERGGSAGGAAAPPALAAAALALAREAAAQAFAPPLLDPVSDLRFAGLETAGPARDRAAAVVARAALPCHGPGGGPALAAALLRLRAAAAARARAASLRASLASAALAAAPDFAARSRLLAELGYLDPVDGAVTVKGRAGCEIAAGDTLALTECLFAGCFAGLGPADAAALLSAFVFQENIPAPSAWPTPTLAKAVDSITRTLEAAAEAQAGAGVPGCGDPAEWCASVFKPGLVPAVHAWASGAPFSEVCELTDVPEGSIVRCVTRTDEAARELRDAARAVGDTGLWGAMEAVSEAIRRDVVFAASLYVS